MDARRFYAMAGDMKDSQEYYCAQAIFGEFVYSYEYDEQEKVIADLRAVNAELLESVNELSSHVMICGHMMSCNKRFASSPDGGVCTCGLNDMLERTTSLISRARG